MLVYQLFWRSCQHQLFWNSFFAKACLADCSRLSQSMSLHRWCFWFSLPSILANIFTSCCSLVGVCRQIASKRTGCRPSSCSPRALSSRVHYLELVLGLCPWARWSQLYLECIHSFDRRSGHLLYYWYVFRAVCSKISLVKFICILIASDLRSSPISRAFQTSQLPLWSTLDSQLYLFVLPLAFADNTKAEALSTCSSLVVLSCRGRPWSCCSWWSTWELSVCNTMSCFVHCRWPYL